MSTTPVMSHQGAPIWGSLALVTYLPHPLGSFLTSLRESVDSERNPDAHITFLPPRELSIPLEKASLEVERCLTSIPSFEVELGGVRVFPKTNSLYLEIKTGRESLLDLHDCFNKGGLFSSEPFEFTPHLTLSGSLPEKNVEAARCEVDIAWAKSGLSPRFWIGEVVTLWQPGPCTAPYWQRLATYPLNGIT